VRDKPRYRKRLLLLLLVGPVIAGCSSTTEFFSSDLLSKDAEWFSRSGRLFIRNISIETPPLTPEKAVTAEDLVSAEGFCAGMGAPANANAQTEGAAPGPTTTGSVALGHTECDVVRGIGPPANVNLSNNPRGERQAVINYSRGQRAGIYTFTAGRLTSIERNPEAVAEPKGGKPRARKKPSAT
jgi:hypothetical protein